METYEKMTTTEIWHQDFNPEKRDNLGELPEENAVYGIFAIVEDKPINCRYVAGTENLQLAIKRLFEAPAGEGLKKFMQGSWIPMLQFQLTPHASLEARQEIVKQWSETYKPSINDDGEYPGYHEK